VDLAQENNPYGRTMKSSIAEHRISPAI